MSHVIAERDHTYMYEISKDTSLKWMDLIFKPSHEAWLNEEYSFLKQNYDGIDKNIGRLEIYQNIGVFDNSMRAFRLFIIILGKE